MQSELDIRSKWCSLNRLTINSAKTKCMYFPAKKYRGFTPPQVSLKNVPQEYVGHSKYLGVHLDSKLNFQTNLNQVYKLASHKIYLLCKIRNLLTEHAVLTIYRSKSYHISSMETYSSIVHLLIMLTGFKNDKIVLLES